MSDDSLGDMTAAVSEAFTAASVDSPSTSSPSPETSSTGDGSGATPIGSPAAQTTDPSLSAAEGGTKPTPGPVDYQRFYEVNERMKKAELRAQEFDSLQRDIAPLLTWRQQFQQDPIAAFGQLAEELQAHPELGQKFRSQAARWLRGGAPKPAETPMPPPDMVDPASGTRLYSAEQAAALVEWKLQQFQGQIEQRIAPLQEREEKRQQLEQAQHAWDGALQRANQTLTEWRKMPGFVDHEAQIKGLVKGGVDLGLAYAQIVVPTLSQRERQAVTQSLQAKTQATTMSPGYSPSGAPQSPSYADTHTAAREIARDVFATLG